MKKELRRYRGIATALQCTVMGDEALYRAAPEFQAEAIIEGFGYHLPSWLWVRTLLVTGELRLKDEVCPACGHIVTREEQRKQKIEQARRILKEKFGPVEITREVTMPLVKDWLERVECQMIERGYRLPKWSRPPWLKEMEAGQN